MGSKPWHKWSVLVTLSFMVIGCNNGTQKSNDVAATRLPPGSSQTTQTAPNYNLPKFPTAPGTTVSTPPNAQFAPATGQGVAPNMSPPPNTINKNSPLNTPNFQPTANSPSNTPNFQPTATGNSNTPPLSRTAAPAFPFSGGNPNPMSPAPPPFANDQMPPNGPIGGPPPSGFPR